MPATAHHGQASKTKRAIGRAGGVRAVSLLLHKMGNVSRISWAGAIQSGVQICVAHYGSRTAAITHKGKVTADHVGLLVCLA
jgi:hypothetical protein